MLVSSSCLLAERSAEPTATRVGDSLIKVETRRLPTGYRVDFRPKWNCPKERDVFLCWFEPSNRCWFDVLEPVLWTGLRELRHVDALCFARRADPLTGAASPLSGVVCVGS